MRARALLGRLLALALGLALGLAVAEGVLRALGRGPDVATVTAEQYEAVPGIFAPAQRLVVRSNAKLPYRVEINELGYRGPDFPRHKAGGEFRILAAGDSYVYGSFVGNEETLPARLERELRPRCGNVRVINAGLGGSTIVDQTEIVASALPLAPDLVLLVFSENDVVDLARPESLWAQLAENRRGKSQWPFSVVYPLLQRTALWNVALEARARLALGDAEAGPPPPPGGRVDPLILDLRAGYRRALVELRDVLAARGIPLVFVVFPSHHSVSGAPAAEQLRWATETAARAGIAAVNLLSPLRETGLPATGLFLLPHDGHPNATAYAVTAAYLARAVSRMPPLATRCHLR